MLEHTLVVSPARWGVRRRSTISAAATTGGRAWSMAMAGCGVHEGLVYGATNELGTRSRKIRSLTAIYSTLPPGARIDSHGNYLIDGQTNPIADLADAAPVKALLS